jgi:hypothetical protein
LEVSAVVRDVVLEFYAGVTTKAIDRFDEIVSAEPATLVIGTAPGEWVTERPRLRFGFETEGITLEPGPRPTGYREGTMGWFVDEPWFGFTNALGQSATTLKWPLKSNPSVLGRASGSGGHDRSRRAAGAGALRGSEDGVGGVTTRT